MGNFAGNGLQTLEGMVGLFQELLTEELSWRLTGMTGGTESEDLGDGGKNGLGLWASRGECLHRSDNQHNEITGVALSTVRGRESEEHAQS